MNRIVGALGLEEGGVVAGSSCLGAWESTTRVNGQRKHRLLVAQRYNYRLLPGFYQPTRRIERSPPPRAPEIPFVQFEGVVYLTTLIPRRSLGEGGESGACTVWAGLLGVWFEKHFPKRRCSSTCRCPVVHAAMMLRALYPYRRNTFLPLFPLTGW